MQGHLPIVEHLCQASADVNIADKDGTTPLYVAAINVSIQSKDCMHVATVMPWVMTIQRLYTSMNT
jgi:ankyrin repeat protein